MMLKITSLALGLLISFHVNAQYKSLMEYPHFKNDKVNLLLDSANNKIYGIAEADSLNKIGELKFQIHSKETRADTIYFKIKRIDALPTLRPRWMGQQFPQATFTDTKGRKVSIADLKGKILVVNFWSITCPACIVEIPQLNQVVDESVNEDIVFLAVTFDKAEEVSSFFKTERLKKFLNMTRPEFKFNLITDEKSFLDQTIKLVSYPATFIVGRDGMIKEMIEGVNLDQDQKPKTYQEVMAAIAKVK